MFSTAPSLWTLETVSGSSQVVSAGQAFQPLVMRVTDGSLAANPVLGVNVTFATTLARMPFSPDPSPGSSPDKRAQPGAGSLAGANGLPILLGSSQAQVVTTQDGLASIVPSAGNAGPCDLFIAVSAGASTAQFQMENLATIVPMLPGLPKSGWPNAPLAPRAPELN